MEGVHRSTSLMSLFLLLQQCPTCLVHLTWVVFVMGGKWPYSCCFVGAPGLVQYCSQHSCVVAVKLFLHTLVSMKCIHTAVSTWPLLRKNCFILSVRSDFHMTDSLSIAVHAFAICMLMSVSVDETLLTR